MKPKLTILVTPATCGHCREALPELYRLMGELQREGVEVELIDLDKKDVDYDVRRVPAFRFEENGCARMVDASKLRGKTISESIRAWMGKAATYCERQAKRAPAAG